MDKLKEYSICLYYRQGDDFRHFLGENGGNVAAALKDWALSMKASADYCLKLSQAMDGKNIVAHAESHHISFEPMDEHTEGLFNVLVKEEMLNEYELDDEGAFDYED